MPATREHVYEMADNLRVADMGELAAFGVTAKKALWRGYRNSIMCRSVFVDGKIAAMWGLVSEHEAGGELLI